MSCTHVNPIYAVNVYRAVHVLGFRMSA